MADVATTTTPGISLGDAMNMMTHANQNTDGSNFAWNNPFMYLIWLAIFGNYGGGLFGNRGAAAAETATDVQSTIYAANDQQTLESMIRSIGTGIADGTYALNTSIKDARCDVTGAVNTAASTINSNLKDNAYALSNGLKDNAYMINNAIKDGDYGIQSQLSAGFNQAVTQTHAGFDAVGKTLMENRFAGQQGVQALQGSMVAIGNQIDSLKYTNAQNTCAIVQAIKDDGAATRALINDNTVQALRDKLAEQGSDLQAARFQISQLNQNAQIINALKPTAGCTCGL